MPDHDESNNAIGLRDRLTLYGAQWDAIGWRKPLYAAAFSFESIAAFFFAALNTYESWLYYYVVIGAIAFAASTVTTVSVDSARRKAESARVIEAASVQLALTDAFEPMMRTFGQMQVRPTDQRDGHFEKAIEKVLKSRLLMFDETIRTRMVIYEFEPPRQGRKRRLVVKDWDGRTHDVPNSFVAGDKGRGDAVLKWLDSNPNDAKFDPDIEKNDDPDYQGSGHGYRTYISVAIIVEQTVFGMISLDAPQPGDLDETDIPMMKVLASYLAAAYATPRK